MMHNILITDKESFEALRLDNGDTIQKMSYVFFSNGDGTFDVYKDRTDFFTVPLYGGRVKRTNIPLDEIMGLF